ncbi:EF-hand_domain [Hexamita inflata]|uniref:EF-hand_domain n=1 Tax=Hexamita inflata TaxID=28002 RepID=A0ABP1HQU9_9EUKA
MKYTHTDFEALFNCSDLDHTKYIEYTELYSFLKNRGMNSSLEVVRDYFQKFDRDCNGKLDKDEWCKMLEQIFK